MEWKNNAATSVPDWPLSTESSGELTLEKKLEKIAGKIDIKKYWFTNERLNKNINIGFMHTFVGEPKSKKGQTYTGFHNWVQYYHQKCELKRIRKEISTDTYPKPVNVKICNNKFDWRAPGDDQYRTKNAVSTIPFGTKPEYDIAVISLCFKNLGEKNGSCTLKINGAVRKIKIFTKQAKWRGSMIRTGFFSG